MTRISRAFVFTALLALANGLAGTPGYGEGGSSVTTKEFERIKRAMQEKKKEIRRANRKERSVLADLEKIDRDIQAGSAVLADQQKQLKGAEAALRGIEENSVQLSGELAGLRKLYSQRLRALYKMRRSGSMAIYAVDSLGSMAKHIKYLSVITDRDRVIIDEFSRTLRGLSERQAEIAEKKEDILGRRRTVEAKKAELETKRQRKSTILAGVRQEKSLYEQTLHELEEASVSLWAMIKRDERERRPAQKANVPPNRREATASEGKSRLPWPLDGPVLTRFGMQRHPQFGTMVFRRGIEIEAREGEAVRAVDSGEVAYADWYKGFGKLVILDHGSGFYTLYGNLSRLDLAKGERVAKGQVIGLAGETGSLKGSKLYFEIRRNGEAQDPLLWLSKR
ncbi:MAG: murein hydrolase activator EnvC family protein [Betaproteobacteria bacterium]